MDLNENFIPQAGTSGRGESRLPKGSCPTDSGGGKHSSDEKVEAFKPTSKLARSPIKKPLLSGKLAKEEENPNKPLVTGTKPKTKTTAKHLKGESKIERRMRLIREGLNNPPESQPQTASDNASAHTPGPSRDTPLEKMEGSLRKGTAQENKEWRTLARGMSGTRVKRFWKLINEGLSGAEAKAEATKGYCPKPNQAMAAKPATSKAKPGLPSKTVHPARNKPTYAKALASVKMAVFAKEGIKETLTKEQLTWISEAILEAIRTEKEIKVKFLAVQFKPETLGIDCANEQSANWLSKAVEELRGWNGPQLKATTADKAPKHTTINVVFPRAAKTEVSNILEMLDHQNEGLRISSWKVVKQYAEGEAKRLIISIDEQSVDAMKRQDWELSYRYGTVRVYLKPIKEGRPQESQVGAQTSADEAQESQVKAQTSAMEEDLRATEAMEEDELLSDLGEAIETMELTNEEGQLSDGL